MQTQVPYYAAPRRREDALSVLNYEPTAAELRRDWWARYQRRAWIEFSHRGGAR